MVTKGEWKFKRGEDTQSDGIKISGDLFSTVVTSGKVICCLPEPHYMPDMGDEMYYNESVGAMKANANLIVTAVNACKQINPDNPQSVAEAIGDMYKALKELTQGYDPINSALKALAKASQINK